MYKKWKINPTNRWKLYTDARNIVTSTVRIEKRKYFGKLLNPAQSTKRLWKNLRSLNVCPKQMETCSINHDELNDFFLSSCVVNSDNSVIDCNLRQHRQNSFDDFSFNSFPIGEKN